MAFNRQKFKNLVHYVIWKAGKRDWFGATKLNKILWFADTRVYVLRGEPITGATYTRQEHGPCPKPIMPVREELEREGSIRISREGKLTRFVALAPPDTSVFSRDELAAVNWWIDHIADEHTAETISDLSHDYAWEIAELGEEIPLYASFATRVRDPNDKEMAWAKEVADRLRLP